MITSYLVQDPANEWDPNNLLKNPPYTQSRGQSAHPPLCPDVWHCKTVGCHATFSLSSRCSGIVCTWHFDGCVFPSITVILTLFNNLLTKRIKVLLALTCFLTTEITLPGCAFSGWVLFLNARGLMDVMERALVEGREVPWFRPQPATHCLFHLGELTQPLWASVSSFVKWGQPNLHPPFFFEGLGKCI